MTSVEGCAFHEEDGLFADEVDVLLADQGLELNHSRNGSENRLLVIEQYSSILGRPHKILTPERHKAIGYL